MEIHNSLYSEICSLKNLFFAYRKARKGKTKKNYVIEFQKNLRENLLNLRQELLNQTYKPIPLKTFIVRDPKTRKISKSAFRDRIVHHALCNILEPIFDKTFIYDSCANRKGKGTLFALKRFELFKRKITKNLHSFAFCFKADIKHYFQEIDRNILLKIIKWKIEDEQTINLIKLILDNFNSEKGMPLGNLTSQFFANVYLNKLDYFVKHGLKIKYYIRYVDDFVILHKSKYQLEFWKQEIEFFLKLNLKLELHKEKSKIIFLSEGIDFIGFRHFYYSLLIRKRNLNGIILKILEYKKGDINNREILEIFNGWKAYSKWANSFELRRNLLESLNP